MEKRLRDVVLLDCGKECKNLGVKTISRLISSGSCHLPGTVGNNERFSRVTRSLFSEVHAKKAATCPLTLEQFESLLQDWIKSQEK